MTWQFIIHISVSGIKKLGEKQLIPGILQARQTPVNAVRVARRVGDLLRRQWRPLLLVYRRVRILAIARELRDVEHGDGHLAFTQRLSNYLHHSLPAVRAPVSGIFDERRLIVTIASFLAAPISAPANLSHFLTLLRIVKWLRKLNANLTFHGKATSSRRRPSSSPDPCCCVPTPACLSSPCGKRPL